MNWKIAGISAVLGVIISYFTWSSFSLAIVYLPLLIILSFVAFLSVVTLLFSIFGTIKILNQEPPLKEKVAERRAAVMKARAKVQKEQTHEIQGRLEQLIAQGKDPFETGIADIENTTKEPKTAENKAKASEQTK